MTQACLIYRPFIWNHSLPFGFNQIYVQQDLVKAFRIFFCLMFNRPILVKSSDFSAIDVFLWPACVYVS